jgi:hypothetical protein
MLSHFTLNTLRNVGRPVQTHNRRHSIKALFNLTKLQMVQSVTQCTDFNKAFFTSKYRTVSRCTRVISLTFIRKTRPSLRRFQETHKHSAALHAGILYRISSKSDNTFRRYRQKFICVWRKRTALLLLSRFSRNSQIIKEVMWRTSPQNLTNVGQEIWKMWVEIKWRFQVERKVWLSPNRFSRSSRLLDAFCYKGLLHQTSWKIRQTV